MPVTGPKRCPDCGYSLKGLPARHRCPECGFPYDEHTLVWRPGRPWDLYVIVALGFLLFPWTLQCAYVGIIQQVALDGNSFVMGAAGVTALVYGLSRLWAMRPKRHLFAALTPRGIRIRTTEGETSIPWEDVDRLDEKDVVPAIKRRSSRKLCRLKWIFDSSSEIRQFRVCLREAQQRYCPQAAGPPVPESVPRPEQTA
jgi:hypothetical protein